MTSSSESYLGSLKASVYLNDAISLVMRVKPDKPSQFILAYFQSLQGNRDFVVGRDFDFINATGTNR